MAIYFNGIPGVIVIFVIYKILGCEGLSPTWVPSLTLDLYNKPDLFSLRLLARDSMVYFVVMFCGLPPHSDWHYLNPFILAFLVANLVISRFRGSLLLGWASHQPTRSWHLQRPFFRPPSVIACVAVCNFIENPDCFLKARENRAHGWRWTFEGYGMMIPTKPVANSLRYALACRPHLLGQSRTGLFLGSWSLERMRHEPLNVIPWYREPADAERPGTLFKVHPGYPTFKLYGPSTVIASNNTLTFSPFKIIYCRAVPYRYGRYKHYVWLNGLLL